MSNIEQYRKRFFNLMESTMGDVRPLIKEQGTTTGTTQTEKQISGPFFKKGYEAVKYFVYEKGGKYYIYMTNASQTTPKLFDGTIYNNNGQGYNTSVDAKDKITSELIAEPQEPGMQPKIKPME